MKYEVKKNPGSEVEITFTISKEKYAPFLEKAAERISTRTAIKGFRKGHVPYELLRKEIGDMAILQEALELIVQSTYTEAVIAEKLDTIGMPKIQIEKAAPDNDVVYKATVALLPEVTLPDFAKLSVQKKHKPVDEKKVTETIDALRGMHAKEVVKTGKAEGTDKLVLDLEMLLEHVPVEGGQAKDYQVYLSEDHYIPGFNAHVAGLQKGDEKSFSLDFPKEHYQKQLAGKNVDFKVKVKEVFARELPEIDEDFAKKLGQESVSKLTELIKNNIEAEAKQKADNDTEVAVLETLIEKTKFADIPEVLIDAERHKIFYELKRDLERHNVPIEKYLQDIKKKEEDLFKDFTVQAEKRAKAALLSRQVALENNLKVSAEDLEKELTHLKEVYAGDKTALENLDRSEVQDSIATTLQNRMVMTFLKEKMVKE